MSMIDNPELYKMTVELCKASALGVDRIARTVGINQNLVARFYIKVFEDILNNMKGR